MKIILINKDLKKDILYVELLGSKTKHRKIRKRIVTVSYFSFSNTIHF